MLRAGGTNALRTADEASLRAGWCSACLPSVRERASSSSTLRPGPRSALLCVLFGATFGLAACGGSAPEPRGALHYAEDAKRAYDKAMVAFNAHDWEDARALFKEVQRKYSYS